MGADGHGQDVTVCVGCVMGTTCIGGLAGEQQPPPFQQKAARRACRNAIEFNSLPSIGDLIPGGKNNMKLHVKIGSPHPVWVGSMCCIIVPLRRTAQPVHKRICRNK